MKKCDLPTHLFTIIEKKDLPVVEEYGIRWKNTDIISSFYATVDMIKNWIKFTDDKVALDRAKKLVLAHPDKIRASIAAYPHFESPEFEKTLTKVSIVPKCNQYFVKADWHDLDTPTDLYYTELEKLPSECLCIDDAPKHPKDPPRVAPYKKMLGEEEFLEPIPKTKSMSFSDYLILSKTLQNIEDIYQDIYKLIAETKLPIDKTDPEIPVNFEEKAQKYTQKIEIIDKLKESIRSRKEGMEKPALDDVHVILDEKLEVTLPLCLEHSVNNFMSHFNDLKSSWKIAAGENPTRSELQDLKDILNPCLEAADALARNYQHIWSKDQIKIFNDYATYKKLKEVT